MGFAYGYHELMQKTIAYVTHVTKMPAALAMVGSVTCFANTDPYDIICQLKSG